MEDIRGLAGISDADMLHAAEVGQDIYVEFDEAADPGIWGVRGRVANISATEQQDGRFELRTYYLECDHDLIDRLDIHLYVDTRSAYRHLTQDVRIGFHGEEMEEREVQDWHCVDFEEGGDA